MEFVNQMYAYCSPFLLEGQKTALEGWGREGGAEYLSRGARKFAAISLENPTTTDDALAPSWTTARKPFVLKATICGRCYAAACVTGRIRRRFLPGRC